jgi:hypothetical protein
MYVMASEQRIKAAALQITLIDVPAIAIIFLSAII